MKKNMMMRIASVLLIAVLMSTSAISGTYAKYVTKGSADDAARVAKWGIKIATWTDGESLFSKTYEKNSETEITNTVSAEENVVAPGTENDKGISFSLTGTPEVAVRLTVEVTDAAGTGDPVDVVLPAGTYTDWTQAPYDTQFAAEEYHPVEFTLKDGETELETGTLADIVKYLTGKSGDYAPGTDMATVFGGETGTCTLTWAWDFDNNGAGTYDKQDTLLGNIAAGIDTTVANASTKIDFAISITATQID